MAEIRCSGCGQIIDVPPELSGDMQLARIEPYYCDECEWMAETAVVCSCEDLSDDDLAALTAGQDEAFFTELYQPVGTEEK
jgi:hypothetical protein